MRSRDKHGQISDIIINSSLVQTSCCLKSDALTVIVRHYWYCIVWVYLTRRRGHGASSAVDFKPATLAILRLDASPSSD